MVYRLISAVLLAVMLLGCDSGKGQDTTARPETTAVQKEKEGQVEGAQEPAAQENAASGAENQEQPGSDVTAAGVPGAGDEALEAQNRDPMELVQKISESSVEELAKLSFLELNLLKNAAYAANGYEFAEDKLWLRNFFCGDLYGVEHIYVGEDDLNLDNYKDREIPEDVKDALESIRKKNASLRAWRGTLSNNSGYDLSLYEFPSCEKAGEIKELQKLAAANVRIAIIKKVEAYTGKLENLSAGMRIPEHANTYYSLGKLFPIGDVEHSWDGGGDSYQPYMRSWEMSLKRELMGVNQLVKLMHRLDNFDQMELLGLYAGDIALLKNIIEAKHGKPFQGVPGWEVSRLIGVTDVNPDYDPKQLPVEVQVRIQLLEETIKKILRSDVSDLPKELQEGTIEITDWYPAAC